METTFIIIQQRNGKDSFVYDHTGLGIFDIDGHGALFQATHFKDRQTAQEIADSKNQSVARCIAHGLDNFKGQEYIVKGVKWGRNENTGLAYPTLEQ